jgi:hypothetical protein
MYSKMDGEFDWFAAKLPYLLDSSERAYRHGGSELGAAVLHAVTGRSCYQ